MIPLSSAESSMAAQEGQLSVVNGFKVHLLAETGSA
jgi:hypothetical protein